MRGASAAVAFACALVSSPAFATSELSCGDGQGRSIDLLVGSLDVLSVSRVVVTVGDKTWSSTPENFPGTPIQVGQAFEDSSQLLLDITDDAVSEIVGRLRVVKLGEGDSRVTAGALSMKGEGVWAVECSDAG